MADDRQAVFARLKESLGCLDTRTPYPDFAPDAATPHHKRGTGIELFRQRLEAANTRVIDTPSALGRLLEERQLLNGYCDPALVPRLESALGPRIELSPTFDRAKVDDFQFGITRASAGILETGTLILNDRDTADRLGAVAPWIHVACLDPGRVYSTLAEAILDLDNDPNVIFVTGHSQTADVEGILIDGVHGPGEQICLFLDSDKHRESSQ